LDQAMAAEVPAIIGRSPGHLRGEAVQHLRLSERLSLCRRSRSQTTPRHAARSTTSPRENWVAAVSIGISR
jgi:hypothetical protein